MAIAMIGRKLGMMRLYDGAGHAHGVSVIELGPNTVTQVRTAERDGYTAVQLGFDGNRKRVNRPKRGHLRKAGVETAALDQLHEVRVPNVEGYELGQALTVDQFEPGQFVNVAGTSKGRGFAGGVKRWNFRGGPKTHGQSDRHRAPGSVGAGTTPGRVFKGLRMAGHMGAQRSTVLNLLVVLTDPTRNLIFVEGSVPGPRGGIVHVEPGRRKPLAAFQPPALPSAGEAGAEPAQAAEAAGAAQEDGAGA
ncbi:MAG: 50S ribosomal protein L3 [Candidatus Rokubacteria bacterium]|nr:50S ribosomal protein L3 [Chloroflexota bacterium]MBM4443399.1 50S ribosomal protein L3 [Candidatus Rokubacteria bacterium]